MLECELAMQIEDGMEQLTVQQRSALQLKVLGYPLAEIASMLDISVTNAGVLIHRARKVMAEQLAPYLGENAG